GRSVWERERIWNDMMGLAGFTASLKAISAIDIALWDAASRTVGLPLYRYLGAQRSSIKAYASTVSYPTADEYVQLALQCLEQGFCGFKIHAYGDPDRDMEVCRAVYEAVGGRMEL